MRNLITLLAIGAMALFANVSNAQEPEEKPVDAKITCIHAVNDVTVQTAVAAPTMYVLQIETAPVTVLPEYAMVPSVVHCPSVVVNGGSLFLPKPLALVGKLYEDDFNLAALSFRHRCSRNC